VNLVVEYMDGGSLEDLVQAGGCDDEGVLASIAQQVLQVRCPVLSISTDERRLTAHNECALALALSDSC
jgi:serine/threonine protein kinase